MVPSRGKIAAPFILAAGLLPGSNLLKETFARLDLVVDKVVVTCPHFMYQSLC